MRSMEILGKLKSGERIMVSLSTRAECGKKYSLTDGTAIKPEQFAAISEFLKPSDPGLMEDSEPQSWEWAG